ncbi:MAG: dienelactone hydrolase family protein [Vicinamibacteria bacterium]|nr:dienelactone hydrolase family protein [Vicinamibacteria bacterium]
MRLEIRSVGPHHGQPIVVAGAPIATARAVGVLLHGRGATALSILDLADAFNRTDLAWLAPQARSNTWYPNRFLAPIESNQPWLSSALAAVADVVAQVEEAGTPRSRIVLIGFSQGACLALETLIRTPGIAGGVAGLSGGLIGPPGTVWPDAGRLDGVPVFLGCSDVDLHIPKERVLESADVLRARGAEVTAILYPGMDHTVNDDEIAHVRAVVDRVAG